MSSRCRLPVLPRLSESSSGGKHPVGESHVPVSRNPHHSALLTQSVCHLSLQESPSVCQYWINTTTNTSNSTKSKLYDGWCMEFKGLSVFKCVQSKKVQDLRSLNSTFTLGDGSPTPPPYPQWHYIITVRQRRCFVKQGITVSLILLVLSFMTK